MSSTHTPSHAKTSGHTERQLPCEEIQALMLNFMHRDLGEKRSDLIREHIRRCPCCHERMEALKSTYGILQSAPYAQGAIPERLSEAHHNRLVRAVMHPVLDWIYAHHILVSIVITIGVITAVFCGLRHYRVIREPVEPGIPVVVGDPKE